MMLEVLMWLGFALLIAVGSTTFIVVLALVLHAGGMGRIRYDHPIDWPDLRDPKEGE